MSSSNWEFEMDDCTFRILFKFVLCWEAPLDDEFWVVFIFLWSLVEISGKVLIGFAFPITFDDIVSEELLWLVRDSAFGIERFSWTFASVLEFLSLFWISLFERLNDRSSDKSTESSSSVESSRASKTQRLYIEFR